MANDCVEFGNILRVADLEHHRHDRHARNGFAHHVTLGHAIYLQAFVVPVGILDLLDPSGGGQHVGLGRDRT